MRPLLVDLFCKQGGAAMGYHRAGFDVVGVDIEPQPRYPFPFFEGDWRAGLRHWMLWACRPGQPFRVPLVSVHASPPCQAYTTGGRTNRAAAPKLIEPVREVLEQLSVPFVIENVPEAPLRDPVVLCGSMFGLKVRRHRLFETSFECPPPPRCDHKAQGPIVGVYGHPHGKRGAWPGMLPSTLESWSDAMGIDWMDAPGLSQAIPPAYTEWLGRQMLASMGVA